MELRTLRSFLVVAQEQSISGAAKVLHITQPSLSRQIMDLEEELGGKLFERGNRKIALTELGILLQKRAGQILDLVQKTREEIDASGDDISGVIHIGSGETLAFRSVAVALHDVIEKYPAVHFHIYSGNSEDVMERLDKGLLDFGLFIEPHDVTKYNYLRLPFVDRWGVLMRKDSQLASFDAITPEDLWNMPIISSRQALDGGQLSSWLKIAPEKIKLVGTYNLLFNASLMVEAGTGYALCLDGLVNIHEDSALCFRPLTPELKSSIDVVWKKNQFFSKTSELFLEKLREYILRYHEHN